MSQPSSLVFAIPSKGRILDSAQGFLERAGLKPVQGRGVRDYRGTIPGLDGVEVAFLSASEIARELVAGSVHLGLTGLDLMHEATTDPEAKMISLSALGFSRADVIVAVPQAWIDVRCMADLDDVASQFRSRNRSRMRVATKYLNLTRGFFDRHGIADYRIVESTGATEGAPAAGAAELIVDITTTGATLAANALKVLDDGVILKSEAHLVASRTAAWSEPARASARDMLDRIASEARARKVREVRTRFKAADNKLVEEVTTRFGAAAPFGGPTSSGMLTLHCPPQALFALARFLRDKGAESVSVSELDYVFSAENPLYETLAAALA
ncbi:ATP phosphoribosyltransferase [Phreatobacter stygius]|uniref:ATP phosphoribosyltransferase n=1 Tax=Phreatobacter stygius TaxID=1940610 RepID=A0A4D7BCB2_9HYPH|nr:ATP phosphoribosyltransferase [Phreatobacter stygius]QCI65682.1 ATP phosphoribosyltransferase [Phreatobacter stygius]